MTKKRLIRDAAICLIAFLIVLVFLIATNCRSDDDSPAISTISMDSLRPSSSD